MKVKKTFRQFHCLGTCSSMNFLILLSHIANIRQNNKNLKGRIPQLEKLRTIQARIKYLFYVEVEI